jgi:hypothetical protein
MGVRQISWVSQIQKQRGMTCVGKEVLDSSAQFQPRQPTIHSRRRSSLFAINPEQMTQAIASTHTGHIGRGRARAFLMAVPFDSRFLK